MSNKYSFLGHKYDPFNKPNILQTSKEYGFEHKDSVEAHLWVYELYYQIQKRAERACVLKGGACAQLYLPLEFQRCTLDIDLATSLTSDELDGLLESIVADFNSHKFYSGYEEYIPRLLPTDRKLIPMKTYLFNLPFIYKKGKRGNFPDIKMDFVFLPVDVLPADNLQKGKTFGLNLKYSPFCLTAYSIICNKLLTFAVNSVGLDTYKVESFYKNIYDLYYLINEHNNVHCFKAVSKVIDDNIRLEFSLKKQKPQDTLLILDDILSTLHNLFVYDLLVEEPRISRRLLDFQEKCLQSNMRKDLNPDIWAIMTMYLFIWVTALRNYVSASNFSAINSINDILDFYEYYQSVEDKKERRKLLKEYRKVIFRKDTRLFLSRSIDPLRIIYLYFIYNDLL